MKIVDRKTFLTLPEGTIYSYYVPQISNGLMVKQETLSDDWIYQDLLFEVYGDSSNDVMQLLTQAEEHGTSFRLDLDCGTRDGMFDNEQMFMVYEKEDITRLVNKLLSLM